jgi:hypothetical protein
VRYHLEQRDPDFAEKMAEVLCVHCQVKSSRQLPYRRKHATFAREHEYERHGPVTLLAGIDLVTGKVHALVKDRHRSREFIEFLALLDAAYPAHTSIKLILDNHSAHISKETKAWLADQPAHRYEFTLLPPTAPGSTWLKASSLAQSCATPVSHPSRNSRIASWLQ